MSFASPWLLLGLLAIPLIVAGYVLSERRRRGQAAAFASAPVMPSVAPAQPGWRRHAPLALFALALTALLAALARPERSVAVPVEQASVVLATDHSGSMQATDVEPNRLIAAREAALTFLDKVPDDVRVGAVAFDHRARAISGPTTDRTRVRAGITTLRSTGGTATGEALQTALAMLRTQKGADGKQVPAAIVLLSDGKSTHGREPLPVANEAKRLGIPIYTVALGTQQGTIPVPAAGGGTRAQPVPPDVETLRRIAEQSGGEAFSTADAEELATVYEKLGSKVAMREEQREMTAGFAGGALILLVAGTMLSLHWFRRPV